jgi:iron complex outermembrane receptor protein
MIEEKKMSPSGRTICAAMLLLIFGGALIASGQEANKIYAQKLLDETLAKHKNVVIMAFHVTPPGKTDNVIIASNIGRIGKKADEDDMRVIETGKPNLEINKKGNHYEVELVLQDQSGKTIGAVGIVFNYEKGKEGEFQKTAELIRDEMKQQTPSLAKLFEPAN